MEHWLPCAYRKTQELIKVADELRVKVTKETRTRIAMSSPMKDQATTTSNATTTASDRNVNRGELSIATAPRKDQRELNRQTREGSLYIRHTHMKLGQPKRERPSSVTEYQPVRMRLKPPMKENFEEDPVPLEAVRHSPFENEPTQGGASWGLGEDSRRVHNSRVLKASAKAGKRGKLPFL